MSEGPETQRAVTDAGARRKLLRRCVLATIAALYVVSVPWYRSTGDEVQVVAGLPDWVAVAVACYVGVAILNGVAWFLTEVPDGDVTDSGPQ